MWYGNYWDTATRERTERQPRIAARSSSRGERERERERELAYVKCGNMYDGII